MNTEYLIGQNIKHLRAQKKISGQELADIVNVRQSSISSYESGKTLPSLNVLGKIALYFDINTHDLTYNDVSKDGYRKFDEKGDLSKQEESLDFKINAYEQIIMDNVPEVAEKLGLYKQKD